MIVKRTWWGFMDIMDILTTMIIGTIVFIGLGLFITYIIIKSGVKSGVKEGLGEVKTVSKSQSKEAVEVKPAKTEAVIDDDFADFKDEFKVEVKRYINKKISEFGLEEFKEDVERRLNRFFKREFDKFYKEDEDMQNLFKKFVDGEDIFELDVCRNKIKEIADKYIFMKIAKDILDEVNENNYKEVYERYKNLIDNIDALKIMYVDKLVEIVNLDNLGEILEFMKSVGLEVDDRFMEKINKIIKKGVKWGFKTESDVKAISIKDNIVILGCDYNEDLGYVPVYAFDLKTGNKMWEFWIEDDIIKTISKEKCILIEEIEDKGNEETIISRKYVYTILIVGVNAISIKDDIVVLGCVGGYISALNLKTGKKIWEFKAEDDVEAISIKDDIVILGCGDIFSSFGYTYALNLKTGNKIWEFKAKESVWSLSIKDDIVVVGCGEGYAYALDLKTGKKIWEFKAESSVRSLSIKDDIVILGCGDRYWDKDKEKWVELGYAPVYALNLKTGNKIWEFKAKESVWSLSIKDDIVVVGCGEGYAYALDLKTGKKIWEFKAEGDVKAISIKDNIVILGCAERYIRAPVYALDLKTGNKIWEFKFEVESDVKVISIKDNIVILGCRYNKDLGYAPVYALDLNKYKKVLEMIENKK